MSIKNVFGIWWSLNAIFHPIPVTSLENFNAYFWLQFFYLTFSTAIEKMQLNTEI